jgi:quinol monooxygenase YgiN
MPPIRVLIQSNHRDADSIVPMLLRKAEEARRAPGCLQFEFFRSPEFPENLVQLELWGNREAFDGYWREHPDGAFTLAEAHVLEAPNHHGTAQWPRRHGMNGVEFYPHHYFERSDDAWQPVDRDAWSETVRWPAADGVRIIIQATSDPTVDGTMSEFILKTRQEPNCLQFDYYRSLDYPENSLHLELWDGPQAYDVHYLNRILDRQWGTSVRPANTSAQATRVYGRDGMEFYQHNFYTRVGTVWQPEEGAQRMVVIHWPRG